jgi:hypothetical protein
MNQPNFPAGPPQGPGPQWQPPHQPPHQPPAPHRSHPPGQWQPAPPDPPSGPGSQWPPQPPHQPFHQPPQAPGGRSKRPRDWGRTWLIAIVAGVLALAGGGSAAFAYARWTGDSSFGPVECGDFNCMRGVEAKGVVAELEDRGFSCEESQEAGYLSTQCELAVGDNRYRAGVTDRDGLVEQLDVSVSYHDGLPISRRNLGFLTWCAVLAFETDPQADTTARRWFADRMHAGPSGTVDQEVKIRGYRYAYRSSRAGQVALAVRGGAR